MFHINDSDVYLTPSNADGMSENKSGNDDLCSGDSMPSLLTSYFKKTIPNNATVSVVQNRV